MLFKAEKKLLHLINLPLLKQKKYLNILLSHVTGINPCGSDPKISISKKYGSEHCSSHIFKLIQDGARFPSSQAPRGAADPHAGSADERKPAVAAAPPTAGAAAHPT
jgi:hypothetical protein